jgi:protein O-GlcNAc transferase
MYNLIQRALEHYKAGQLPQAIKIIEGILKDQPDNAELLYFLGIIYAQSENYDLAIEYLKRSLQLNANNADAYLAVGLTSQRKGLTDDAIRYYNKSLSIDPKKFEVYNSLGDAFTQKGLIEEAIITYQTYLQTNPYSFETYNNMGNLFQKKWEIAKAIDCYYKAIEIDPENASAYNNLGNTFQIKGRPEEAEKFYRQAMQKEQNTFIAYQNLIFIMNYNPRYDARTIFSEHVNFAQKYALPLSGSIIPHTNNKEQQRRLRIGYVSPDFRRHSVAYFIEPVLAAHDKEQFEVFCYSISHIEDEVTERLRGYADHWRNIVGFSDEKATEIIRNDSIDILVDLAGHTTNNRIMIFARKPAPIQVNWIGYPSTTGLPTMDYKIVDNYTDPPDMTEQYYTEKLVRLPGSFLCYLPEQDSPDIEEPPSIKSGFITFGSFNNLSKVSRVVFALWSRILKRTENSRLIMKSLSFSDRETRSYTMDMFKQEGIQRERIDLLPPALSTREHLKTYHQIDIAFDTFPYNGTTTTCEAIWMGVPVITFAGSAHLSRAGASLLSNTGIPEFIAKTADEYVEMAVKLANNIEKLRLLRTSLRDMMADSPLTDAKRFTGDLENIYRKMWGKWISTIK